MSRIQADAQCKALIHSHLNWLLGNQGSNSIGLHKRLEGGKEPYDFERGYRAAIQDARQVIEDACYQEEFQEERLKLRIKQLEEELRALGAGEDRRADGQSHEGRSRD